MIDILYVSFNRLIYTRESLHALIENTDWTMVRRLVVVDDASHDGSLQHIRHTLRDFDLAEVVIEHKGVGGPVAATNLYLERYAAPIDVFAKIDNDFIVCPGWLGEMLRVWDAHPQLHILGTEPFTGGPTDIPDPARGIDVCNHIGGKGLIRVDAFRGRPMWADGRQGFTQWQHRNEDLVKAWITPDIPTFGLDQLPREPWLTLSARYEQIKVDGGVPMHRTLGQYHPNEQYSAWWQPHWPPSEWEMP